MEMLAISGIGVYQNNMSLLPMALGQNTLPDFYNRTLQSEPEIIYDASENVPDLVVYFLGGNDYISQMGHLPTDSEFMKANEDFWLEIFETYGE